MTYWLNKESRQFLENGYLLPGQTPEQRIDIICNEAERILNKPGFAKEFREYMEKGWISLSSPVWSNFATDRGLPISCNNSYFEDNIESILSKTAEIGMQTKQGAGTSAYLGDLRARGSAISAGGKSFGPVHFMEMLETTIGIISQSNVRRGSCAVYLPIEHPDVMEFLECREEGHKIQNLSLGVCVSDDFMNEMISGDEAKKKIWVRVLKKRFETGFPYIFFTDTVNRNAPEEYKKLGRKIHSSNLCSEIALSSNHDESFVCNLASLNILHYEEWKDSNVAQALVYFLDAVMSEYIEKAKKMPLMETAYNFAVRQRAIGIGTLGWHSYLQSRMIPFESVAAQVKNTEIHRFIRDETLKASKAMALEYGEPDLLKGSGRRHMTLMAIAPTTSSSFILGQVSPSIEPQNTNYYPKDLAKGVFTYRNPYLKTILDKHGKDDHDTWRSILLFGGSVQQLDFLSIEEKNVFKTFGEIGQREIIIQAAGRQRYIDQAQSLNLKIHPKTPIKDVNTLIIDAWKFGVKTLYYQRSTNAAQEYNRNLLSCQVCEA